MSELDKSIRLIKSSINTNKARNAIWKSFMGEKCSKNKAKGIKIALLNAPCHGFGDVIFARKLALYLKEWYNAEVKIFTTLPDAHIKLGAKKEELIKAKNIKYSQCRIFKKLEFSGTNKKYDLYFIAPAVSTYAPKLSDIIKNFKYATKTNVFSFSEYNSATSGIDFRTGIGGKRLGMLFTKPPPTKRLSVIKNPYVMLYIASEEHISNARVCYKGFMEMVAKKYHKKHKKIDIVVPTWITEEVSIKILKNITQYYPRIILKTKDDIQELTKNGKEGENTLTIRGDIYPLDNKKMFSLIKYSLQDILVTGDQSITDVLSCCSDKNIFYQIAEWKQNFAKHLAELLPNKYLLSKKTSCGTIKAIKYRSNYKKFIQNWDFRKSGKEVIDALVLSVIAIKNDKDFKKLAEIINNKRTIKSLKNEIRKKFT